VDDGGSQLLQQAFFFALLLLGFYLLAIRPQRTRAKAMAEVRAALQVGSRVMTTAGIHGTVVSISPSDADADGADAAPADTVLLEVAKGVHVRFATPAVVRLLGDDVPGGSSRKRAG
jgi:preprotein translocase subunit YajC